MHGSFVGIGFLAYVGTIKGTFLLYTNFVVEKQSAFRTYTEQCGVIVSGLIGINDAETVVYFSAKIIGHTFLVEVDGGGIAFIFKEMMACCTNLTAAFHAAANIVGRAFLVGIDVILI